MCLFELTMVLFIAPQTRSLLIKYGLKLTIESKRKQSAGDSSGTETSKSNRKDTINSMDTSDDDEDDDDDDDMKSPKNGVRDIIIHPLSPWDRLTQTLFLLPSS